MRRLALHIKARLDGAAKTRQRPQFLSRVLTLDQPTGLPSSPLQVNMGQRQSSGLLILLSAHTELRQAGIRPSKLCHIARSMHHLMREVLYLWIIRVAYFFWCGFVGSRAIFHERDTTRYRKAQYNLKSEKRCGGKRGFS